MGTAEPRGTTTLAFVDVESTGLDPARNEVWEIGLILRDAEGEREFEWQLPVDLSRADSVALTIGRFYERRNPRSSLRTPSVLAGEFARLTHGTHLVGAVPSFDDAFLKRLLRANGACPGWHYHLIDVEALAAGWLEGRWALAQQYPDTVQASDVVHRGAPPWNSNDLSRAVGVDPEDFDRHTALGDARWAKAIYDRVMGSAPYPTTTPDERTTP